MAPTPPPQTEITPKTDLDALARAAIERAEKAEKQNGELKKQLEAARQGKGSKDGAGIAEMQAEIARLRNEREEFLNKMEAAGDIAAAAKRGPAPLAPEHRGKKKYRLEKPHYRGGIMYGPGQQGGAVIEVTDEKPGKGWIEVKRVAATTMVDVESAPAEPTKRSADVEV